MEDNIVGNQFCGYWSVTNDNEFLQITGIVENDKYVKIDDSLSLTEDEKNIINNKQIIVRNPIFENNKRLRDAPFIDFLLIYPERDRIENEYVVSRPNFVERSNERMFNNIKDFARKVAVVHINHEKNVSLDENVAGDCGGCEDGDVYEGGLACEGGDADERGATYEGVDDKMRKTFLELFDNNENNQDALIEMKIKLLPDENAIKYVYDMNKRISGALCVLSVEPDWIHFDDYINHGLLEIWEYAFDNPNRNCNLVIQNINLTLPEAGLTPLFDVMRTFRPKLPYSKNIGFPGNLNIFATFSRSNMKIKLSKEFFNLCSNSLVSESLSLKFDDVINEFGEDDILTNVSRESL